MQGDPVKKKFLPLLEGGCSKKYLDSGYASDRWEQKHPTKKFEIFTGVGVKPEQTFGLFTFGFNLRKVAQSELALNSQ